MVGSKKKSGRIAVYLKGVDEKHEEHLLAIPEAPGGKGKEEAQTVTEELSAGVLKSIVALSFDTTPTNTGKDLGATTLIEQFVGRPLLWLACRHHSSELILMRAFEIIMHFDTKSPGVEIFKKFQREFEDILINSENFNRLEVEDLPPYQQKLAD